MADNNYGAMSKRNISAVDRRRYALQLRSAGLDYRSIFTEVVSRFGAEMLPPSYDERYVWRDVKFEIDKIKKEMSENANDLRILEMNRLDDLQTALMPKALQGDVKYVDRILKIMHQRAMLFGLYAPVHSKVEVSDWHSEIIDLIKQGKVTREQAEEELGKEFVTKLLDTGSADIVEGSFVEGQSE